MAVPTLRIFEPDSKLLPPEPPDEWAFLRFTVPPFCFERPWWRVKGDDILPFGKRS